MRCAAWIEPFNMYPVVRFRLRSTFRDRGLSGVVRAASPAGRKSDQRVHYFLASALGEGSDRPFPKNPLTAPSVQ